MLFKRQDVIRSQAGVPLVKSCVSSLRRFDYRWTRLNLGPNESFCEKTLRNQIQRIHFTKLAQHPTTGTDVAATEDNDKLCKKRFTFGLNRLC